MGAFHFRLCWRSRDCIDRVATLEAELRAKLAPEQVQAALARGQAAALWKIVAVVQAAIGPADVQTAFRPTVLSTAGRGAGGDARMGGRTVRLWMR